MTGSKFGIRALVLVLAAPPYSDKGSVAANASPPSTHRPMRITRMQRPLAPHLPSSADHHRLHPPQHAQLPRAARASHPATPSYPYSLVHAYTSPGTRRPAHRQTCQVARSYTPPSIRQSVRFRTEGELHPHPAPSLQTSTSPGSGCLHSILSHGRLDYTGRTGLGGARAQAARTR